MTAPGIARRRILVVDDEPDLTETTGCLLSHYGFEVSIACSGFEALRMLQDGKQVDAVFSDVVMPGMTGLELAAAVGQLDGRIKVVLTSGFIPPALLASGGVAYPYAAKPYQIETVIGLLAG